MKDFAVRSSRCGNVEIRARDFGVCLIMERFSVRYPHSWEEMEFRYCSMGEEFAAGTLRPGGEK